MLVAVNEFAGQFEELEPAALSARIDLETFIQYQKPLRNLQLQEGRLQRQREKDIAELRELQQERRKPDKAKAALAKITTPAGKPDMAFLEELLERATAPQPDPDAIEVLEKFGFDFSTLA